MNTAVRDHFKAMLRFPELVTGGVWRPLWRSDGTTFCVLTAGPGETRILEVDPETGGARPLIDMDQVRAQLEALGVRPLPGVGLPGELRLTRGGDGIEVSCSGRYFEVDTSSGAVREVAAGEQYRRRNRVPREVRKTFLGPRMPVLEVADPTGELLLTERDGDLWVRATADDRVQRLTKDGNDDVRWSVEGAVWSPDGRRVAALCNDNTGVDRLPVVHWLKSVEEVELVPYTKTGARRAVSSLSVVSVGGEVMPIDIGRPGADVFALRPLLWTGSGELLFVITDRRNRVLQLRAADPSNGQSRVIVEERAETFVYGIRLDAIFTSATPTPDGRIIWMSERDGWRHPYLYEIDGSEVCRLTSGAFEVQQVFGFGPGFVYLGARSDLERPYDVHLCRVGLDGSDFCQLTRDPGSHSGAISPSGQVVVDIHSSPRRPPRTDLLRPDGTLIATIEEADASAVDELGYTPPEEFTASALDCVTTLHGVMFKPPGFDSSRSYPLVEYIYAGPQIHYQPTDYRSVGMPAALAAAGFVTIVVDGSGTPGRGKAFQDVVAGRFGQYEVQEHAHVVRQLTERFSYIDATRVGIIGGSWGGYNTVRALLLEPDIYRVGVAIFPVADCLDHIGMAIEPYLGLPEDNPQAYAKASSLPLVGRLTGKLLMIHGTSDVNSPFGGTMKLADAFIGADRPFDLLVVPELDHSTLGHRGTYALVRAVDYLSEHLVVDGAREGS